MPNLRQKAEDIVRIHAGCIIKCALCQQTEDAIFNALTEAANGSLDTDAPYMRGTTRWLKGEQIKVSTGICGGLTFGYGDLDSNGYWQFPVHPFIAELLIERFTRKE